MRCTTRRFLTGHTDSRWLWNRQAVRPATRAKNAKTHPPAPAKRRKLIMERGSASWRQNDRQSNCLSPVKSPATPDPSICRRRSSHRPPCRRHVGSASLYFRMGSRTTGNPAFLGNPARLSLRLRVSAPVRFLLAGRPSRIHGVFAYSCLRRGWVGGSV